MASIKLLLNKDQSHKDGTFPLVFQIIHRRKKIIYTPYRIFADEFDTVNHKDNYECCQNKQDYSTRYVSVWSGTKRS